MRTFYWRHADRRELDRGRSAGGELRSLRYIGTGITVRNSTSTASYQAHDLTGIGLVGNNLAGVNLAGQNLTNANFYGATLTARTSIRPT